VSTLTQNTGRRSLRKPRSSKEEDYSHSQWNTHPVCFYSTLWLTKGFLSFTAFDLHKHPGMEIAPFCMEEDPQAQRGIGLEQACPMPVASLS
jgi:hypothetical protein